MTDEEKKYWVALSQCPGIGPLRFLSLYSRLQKHSVTIKTFWHLPESQVTEIISSKSILESLLQHRQTFTVEENWKKLQTQKIHVVSFTEDEYPILLREIPDKPPVLYVKGSLHSINQKPYAIVGTRNITPYGTFVTKKIVQDLVKNSCSIISGFMYGVDAVAHQTAIEEGGYTVGVLGFGFNHMYPPNHAKLAEKVLEHGGALMTEYFIDHAPHPGNFPARNRIVAGLSLGIVVTEAAKKSGSKITAQFALEYGRDVFAVPGAITSQYSDGTKDLINDGAKLVTSAEDILHEMQESSSPITLATLLEKCQLDIDKNILSALFAQPLEIDELSQLMKTPVSQIAVRLSVLELDGVIVQAQGKYNLSF